MRLTSCGMTDVGRRRNHNEDNFLINDKLQLYVVCDGMGGHAGGEVASAIAIHTIEETFFTMDWSSYEASELDSLAEEQIKFSVLLAGRKIFEVAEANPAFKGMGTTCVAMFVCDDVMYIGHVGDSRCYLVRQGNVDQITEDHSWVNQQILAGKLTEEKAKNHPYKNVITRSLGFKENVEVDVIKVPMTQGDQFLLCSDGLSNLVEGEEMKDLLLEHSPQAASRQLINLACERGGDDNITVLILKVDEEV
jgi:serine/threonine protein phosphatase PrpC